jgi:hypothetical protein
MRMLTLKVHTGDRNYSDRQAGAIRINKRGVIAETISLTHEAEINWHKGGDYVGHSIQVLAPLLEGLVLTTGWLEPVSRWKVHWITVIILQILSVCNEWTFRRTRR